MSESIKGITIEFRGNATPLQKAIRTVNSDLKKTSDELRSVDKALKFNPTNVDLWRQKQELLKQKISETKDKLDVLKQEQKQMDAAQVDKNSAEYRKLEREIIETTSQLKTFEGQLRKIGNVNLRAMSEQFKEMGNKLTVAGQSMREFSMAGAAVVGVLGTMAYKASSAADDINTMSKIYSISTQDLQKYKLVADQVDVSVETIAKSHVKLEKQMYAAKDGTGSSAEAFKALGVEITDANGNLREGDSIWQETIAALGRMENETERDAIAMQLMGRSAAELNPLIEDGGETYKRVAELFSKYNLDLIDQETLDNANEFRDRLDDIKSMGSLAFSILGARLAEYLLPVMEKAVEAVGRFVEWLSKLDPKVLAIIGAIAGVVAVIGPLLLIIGKISFAISSIMGLMSTLGVSFAALAAPIGIAIAAVTAIIAIFVVWRKYGDQIKAWLTGLGQHIKNIFTQIRTTITSIITQVKTFLTSAWNAIVSLTRTAFSVLLSIMTSPFTNAYNIIKGIVSKLKGLFPLKIGKVFSGLKLPHFKVSGGKAPWGLGGKGSLPHWSVDWYAKGGIFNSPSVIGVGEAGSEAVVPLDKFWDKLDNMSTGETNIVININGANKDPVQIAEEVKRILIDETNRRRLAWQ